MHLTSVISLLMLFTNIAFLSFAKEKANLPKPKAIVLIYADDLGYGDVGCYGAKGIPTPSINKLAKQGLRFTNAYSTTSVCTPSRYALMTGEYPWRQKGTGILPGDAALIIDTNRTTLPKMLQSHGYKTYMIGKWHLGLGRQGEKINWNKTISPCPNQIGFDESFIFAATGDRVPCVLLENGNVHNLDPNDPIEVSYQKNFPGLPNGKDNKDLLKMMWSHGHNQAVINGIGRIGFMKGGKSALWVDEDNADVITKKAIEYIDKSASAKEPFFLMFAAHDIHVPRTPHQRFVGASKCGIRGDVTVQFDDCVRRITKALDKHGLTKDTLLILSSDNGPVLDDGYKDFAVRDNASHKPAGPFRAGKYSILEGGTRIPFIVRWPAVVKPGQSSTAIINQMDLAASLEQLLSPGVSNSFKDSQNVLPAILGKSQHGREYHVINSTGKSLAIRHGKWKYIPEGVVIRDGINGGSFQVKTTKSPKGGSLFNLKDDPKELHNVAKKHPDICKKLEAKLNEIRRRPQSAADTRDLLPLDD